MAAEKSFTFRVQYIDANNPPVGHRNNAQVWGSHYIVTVPELGDKGWECHAPEPEQALATARGMISSICQLEFLGRLPK